MGEITSDQRLRDHPKTLCAARALHTSRTAVIGHLHGLWWWALSASPDGTLSSFTVEEIAEAAMWTRDAGKFVDALVSCGFLDGSSTVDLRIHDWADWSGRVVARRRANAERMRAARATHVQTRAAHKQGLRTEGDHLVSKYLDKLTQATPKVWGRTSVPEIIEIAAEFGFSDVEAGRMLARVWDWWSVQPVSRRRGRYPASTWRGWCSRERRGFVPQEAPDAALNGSQPAPVPLPPVSDDELRRLVGVLLGLPSERVSVLDVEVHGDHARAAAARGEIA